MIVRIVARGGERQRDAVHQRHLDVGQQQIEAAVLAREDVERVRAVDGGHHLMAEIGQRARGQRAQRLLVFGDQNARHRAQAFFSTTPTNGNCRNACATSMP